MTNSTEQEVSTFWDHLNIKVPIGSLQFDFLLDQNIVPRTLDYVQEKHNHAAFEMQCILSGMGTLIIDGNEHLLEPGFIHLIGPNIFHAVKPNLTEPLCRITLRFTIRAAYNYDPLFPHGETELFKSLLFQLTYCRLNDKQSSTLIIRLMEAIRSELEAPSLGTYANVHSLFTQVIIHLVRAIQLDLKLNSGYIMPSKTKDDLRSHIIDVFFMGYQQPLTLNKLAAQLNLSTKQVNRLLKRYFNTSFKQKLRDTRVEVAKDLLRMSNLPIESIAGEVGYSSTQYFSRMFMQKAGMTPSEYRSSLQITSISAHSIPEKND